MTEHYSLIQTVAPTEEPVSLAEAKAHLRITSNDEDALIASLIAAARENVESTTGRQLVTATWRMKLDEWPGVVEVPRPRLQSVTSVAYLDTAGATQSLSPTLYRVELDDEPGRIVPAYAQTWPTVHSVLSPIAITYVSGYGAASAVPFSIKAAMLLHIGHLFSNREAVVAGVGTSVAQLPQGVDALLWPYRIF